MTEFYVYVKMTRDDIVKAATTGTNTGLVIAHFTAEAQEGWRIAKQIAEYWLDRYFPGEWEDLGNGQYRLKGDDIGVAANINTDEVQS